MKLLFNINQIKLLNRLNLPFDFNSNLTDEQVMELDNRVTDYFSGNCIINDSVTEEGIICESIIDLIQDSDF